MPLTVAQLIERLQDMPAHRNVALFVDDTGGAVPALGEVREGHLNADEPVVVIR